MYSLVAVWYFKTHRINFSCEDMNKCLFIPYKVPVIAQRNSTLEVSLVSQRSMVKLLVALPKAIIKSLEGDGTSRVHCHCTDSSWSPSGPLVTYLGSPSSPPWKKVHGFDLVRVSCGQLTVLVSFRMPWRSSTTPHPFFQFLHSVHLILERSLSLREGILLGLRIQQSLILSTLSTYESAVTITRCR